MSTANSDNNTGNLKPFEPGKSGNPSGRPKMPEDIKEALRKITKDSLPVLRAIALGIHEQAKPSDQLKAIEMAFDRVYGKPIQAIEADVNSNIKPLDTSKLSREQKDALIELATGQLLEDN